MADMFDLDKLVYEAIRHRASDVHFQTGDEPQLRIDGNIRQINLPKVDSQQIEDLKSLILDDRSARHLDQHGAVDRGYEVKADDNQFVCRLRVNDAARNLIREHKSFHLNSVMQTQRRQGMITMTQSLIDLYAEGSISGKTLIENAPDVSRAKKYVKNHPSK